MKKISKSQTCQLIKNKLIYMNLEYKDLAKKIKIGVSALRQYFRNLETYSISERGIKRLQKIAIIINEPKLVKQYKEERQQYYENYPN